MNRFDNYVLTPTTVAKELLLEFWGGECGFKLRPLPCGVREEYTIRPQNSYGAEDGGVEYSRILMSRPPSNVLSYDFDSWGLDFCYQPKVVPVGHRRPDHIRDSYAVYHKTKTGNQYKTGKAGHIYRTWAEDRRGWRVWCGLVIGRREIRQILPRRFWKEAKYPVIVDPEFGFNGIGGSNGSYTADNIVGSKFALGGSGTVTAMHQYNSGVGLFHSQVAIYDDDGTATAPATLKGNSGSVLVPVGPSWTDFTGLSIALTAGDWWLVHNNDANQFGDWPYDSSTNQGGFVSQTYNTWPNPVTGWTLADLKFSIYAEYDAPAPDDLMGQALM